MCQNIERESKSYVDAVVIYGTLKNKTIKKEVSDLLTQSNMSNLSHRVTNILTMEKETL